MWANRCAAPEPRGLEGALVSPVLGDLLQGPASEHPSGGGVEEGEGCLGGCFGGHVYRPTVAGCPGKKKGGLKTAPHWASLPFQPLVSTCLSYTEKPPRCGTPRMPLPLPHHSPGPQLVLSFRSQLGLQPMNLAHPHHDQNPTGEGGLSQDNGLNPRNEREGGGHSSHEDLAGRCPGAPTLGHLD